MRCTECSKPVRPVVAVDIDGTLGDYHTHLVNFAEQYLDRALPRDYAGVGEFSDSLGLDKHEYRTIKLAYRQGGMKRSMPAFPRAAEFIQELRSCHIELWITTTRPFLRLDNIDPDTQEWLRRNKITFDGLLYDEDKYSRLVELVDKERIVAVIDDLPEMVDAASGLGLHVVQRWTHWNRSDWRHPGDGDYRAIFKHVLERLEAWPQ